MPEEAQGKLEVVAEFDPIVLGVVAVMASLGLLGVARLPEIRGESLALGVS